MWLRAAAVLCTAGLIGMGVVGPAAAATPASAEITGLSDDHTFLGGTFAPSDFAVDPAGRLIVNGRLSASVSRRGSLQTKIDERITMPVDRAASTATCWQLNMAMGPVDLSSAGVRLDRANLIIEMKQGPGTRLLMPMCAFADQIKDAAIPDSGLLPVLNQILAYLRGEGL